MKNPVAFATAAVVGVVSFFLGHMVGKSSAAKRLEELQQEILRLQQLIHARDAMETQLRANVQRAWQEIELLRGQQVVIDKFTEWMAQEHPEVLRRYREIQHTEKSLATLARDQLVTRRELWEKQAMLNLELAKSGTEIRA